MYDKAYAICYKHHEEIMIIYIRLVFLPALHVIYQLVSALELRVSCTNPSICWYTLSPVLQIRCRVTPTCDRMTLQRTYGYHDDVIKWKHFRVTGPLCGEFAGHR